MVIPPVGAGAAIVTVPREVSPLRIETGLTDRLVGKIGFTVRPALTLTPPLDAVRTTAVAEVTVPAVAVNEAVVVPCGTVTEAGMDTAGLELESVMVTPPVGAGVAIVTVPCAVCPLRIAVGVSVTPANTIGYTVKTAVTLAPPLEAMSTTGVVAVTIPAVAVKDAVVNPCGTRIDAGTDTTAFELESATVIPPVGAAAEIVSVPCVVCPLRITPGVMDKAEGTIGLMVRLALRFTPAADPVITTGVAEFTMPAVAVNVAVVAP